MNHIYVIYNILLYSKNVCVCVCDAHREMPELEIFSFSVGIKWTCIGCIAREYFITHK
jgi:hypothetical protein